MNPLRHVLLGLFVCLVVAPAFAQHGSEPVRATDLFQIRQLEDVAASPDGRHVAYTVKMIVEDPEKKGEYAYRTHLFLLGAGSEEPHQLTHGDREAASPAWHPDGDRIAFVRKVDGKPQIFVIPVYGGEAYQLTDFEHGATAPRWSPDGSLLLFASTLSEKALRERLERNPEWPGERPGRRRGDVRDAEPRPEGSLDEVRAWLEQNEQEGNPRLLTRLNLQGEHDLEPELSFRHYFVVDATTPKAEPVMITDGFYSFEGATWLPGGHQIVLSGAIVEHQHPDRVRDSDLFLVDVEGERFNRLLSLDGYALRSPQPSPDGRLVSFLARAIDDPGYAQTELGIFGLDGRTPPALLTLHFDRSLEDPQWSHDSWFLFFTAPSEGGFPLFRLPVAQEVPIQPATAAIDGLLVDTLAADSLTGDSLMVRARSTFTAEEVRVLRPEVERLTNREHGIRAYDLTPATVYYVLTEATNPYELYAANMEFTQQRRLTEHNYSWLKDKRLSLPEKHTLRRDTLRIDYWVMPPTFYERDRKYPMLLEIHGGPMAMWGPGEATMWLEFQFFAAQGYGVVYSNPRGSGGYGYHFKRLNYQDWGTGPAGDVLAVATEVARRQRWVDRDRQAVVGGSYAGYLTAWIVAHDHRFRAAVAQRGVYDLSTFLGEGNAWRLVPSHFGGYPWEEDIREILIQNSPITYVDQIETPLLIMHGDNDLRTGVSQSEMLYKSLKILEKPVEYVRYPDAGHDLSRTGDPKQRLDRILRIYEFIERYIDR